MVIRISRADGWSSTWVSAANHEICKASQQIEVLDSRWEPIEGFGLLRELSRTADTCRVEQRCNLDGLKHPLICIQAVLSGRCADGSDSDGRVSDGQRAGRVPAFVHLSRVVGEGGLRTD